MSSRWFLNKINKLKCKGITTAEAVYPGQYVNFVRGRLLIHEWAGFSAFVLDPLGNHRIGKKVELWE